MKYFAKYFAFLISFIAMAFTITVQAQQEEFILYAEEAGWQVFEQHAQTSDDVDGCYAFREQGVGDAVFFVFVEGSATLMIQRGDWQLPPNSTYPVYLQIDNNDPIEANIYTLDSSDAVMVEEDITSILAEIQGGSTLYLHTEATTLQYDMSGSYAAINYAQACLKSILDKGPTNPFLADGNNGGGSNPFLTNQSPTATNYVVEPFIDIDSYEIFFIDLIEFGLQVEVAPSEFLGTYQTLVEDAVYNFYWEEDSTTRDTVTIYADASAAFNENCKDMAATKLVEEVRASHVFHQGSVACSDPENDISLFFRVSIFNWQDLGRALIFVTTGDLTDREMVEIIDDILAENVRLILDNLDE